MLKKGVVLGQKGRGQKNFPGPCLQAPVPPHSHGLLRFFRLELPLYKKDSQHGVHDILHTYKSSLNTISLVNFLNLQKSSTEFS